jgi:pimeloyl-ACP methyl ester carboxylesterase
MRALNFLSFLPLLLQAEISFAAPVNDQIRLEIDDGVEVFVEISGENDDAPLLMFLHGGPGNVGLGLVPFQINVGRQLEKDFLVAYPHQRGAGHSDPVPAEEQTFENLVDDVDLVVEYLFERYRKDTLYIVGHSWGGMLTALYADKYPGKTGGLVLISTAMNLKSMLRDGLKVTMEWARENEVVNAVEQLGQIDQSFETWRDFGTLSRWANQANGGVTAHFDMDAFLADNRINEEFPDWGEVQLGTAMALFDEWKELDLDEEISAFEVPALFISGEEDTIVPIQTVRHDYDNYGGEKKLVVLEDSHHLPFMDQPDVLAREIRDFLVNREQ